ncbi:hypothetical protein MP638_004488 [Amoeboaphelidium occidentale]|nr:hypothetical protein MP638_004488 [Amoeboaphelidium occidentale]
MVMGAFVYSVFLGIDQRKYCSNKMSSAKKVAEKISWAYYQYELLTALYMLEPWEKYLFNSVLLAFIFLSAYTSFYYVPEYFSYTLFILTDYFPALKAIVPGDSLGSLTYFNRRKNA